jgi:Glycosyl hydrolase catalytic core
MSLRSYSLALTILFILGGGASLLISSVQTTTPLTVYAALADEAPNTPTVFQKPIPTNNSAQSAELVPTGTSGQTVTQAPMPSPTVALTALPPTVTPTPSRDDRDASLQPPALPTGAPPASPAAQGLSSALERQMGLAWPQHLGQIEGNLSVLNMRWFSSNWSPDLENKFPNQYVPITRCGLPSELAGLPSGYSGDLIVFNEPNLPEPNGCPLSPDQANARYWTLRRLYPQARMVVGNPSLWPMGLIGEWKWMSAFAALIRDVPPYAWGIHAYDEAWINTTVIANALNDFVSSHQADRIWITETGVCSGDKGEAARLIQLLRGVSNIERIGFYTDEQPAGVPWGICDGRTNLFRNGSLTDIGILIAGE